MITERYSRMIAPRNASTRATVTCSWMISWSNLVLISTPVCSDLVRQPWFSIAGMDCFWFVNSAVRMSFRYSNSQRKWSNFTWRSRKTRSTLMSSTCTMLRYARPRINSGWCWLIMLSSYYRSISRTSKCLSSCTRS